MAPTPFTPHTITQESLNLVARDDQDPRDARKVLHTLGTQFNAVLGKLGSAASQSIGTQPGQVPSLNAAGQLAAETLPRAGPSTYGAVAIANPQHVIAGTFFADHALSYHSLLEAYGGYGQKSLGQETTPTQLGPGFFYGAVTAAHGWPLDGVAIIAHFANKRFGVICVTMQAESPLLFAANYAQPLQLPLSWHWLGGALTVVLSDWVYGLNPIPLPIPLAGHQLHSAMPALKVVTAFHGYHIGDIIEIAHPSMILVFRDNFTKHFLVVRKDNIELRSLTSPETQFRVRRSDVHPAVVFRA